MTEEQKIEAFLNGNDEYYEVIYNKYKLLVYKVAKSVLHNEIASEDITQDVFIILYQKRDTIQDPGSIGAWLKRTAYNRAVNVVTREKEVLTNEETEDLFDVQENTDSSVVPEDCLDQKETAAIVKDFLFNLSEEQRAVMMAYYFDQMKISEIAETLGCSENTIKSRMNYAKKALFKMASAYEQKEGVRLHSLGGTIVLLAFLKLQEGVTMTESTSSAIYASACNNIGISAAAAATKGEAAAKAASAANGAQTGAEFAKKTAASTAKTMFLKTGAGKAVVGVVAAATVTAGVAAYRSPENVKEFPTISEDARNVSSDADLSENPEATEAEMDAGEKHFFGVVVQPEDVVLKMFDALQKGDYEKAAACLDPTTEQRLDFLGRMASALVGFFTGEYMSWGQLALEAAGATDVDVIECYSGNYVMESDFNLVSEWMPRIPGVKNLVCTEADVYIKYRYMYEGKYRIEEEICHVKRYGWSGWRIELDNK